MLQCLECGDSGEGEDVYGDDAHDDEASYLHGYWGRCDLKMVL